MKTSDSLLIGFDCSNGKDDSAVLIIGRKEPNETVKIINAFQGADAQAMYERLITNAKRE